MKKGTSIVEEKQKKKENKEYRKCVRKKIVQNGKRGWTLRYGGKKNLLVLLLTCTTGGCSIP